jgi:hypothetical protein
MSARNAMRFVFERVVVPGLVAVAGCGTSDSQALSESGEIPIASAAGAGVPYQLGANPYGVAGGTFLAKANMGSSTVVLDTVPVGQICLHGTVERVPTPADGSHPPYSDYWGIELGFNLNQATDGTKNPWTVPAGVTGFWFTLEGQTIPPLRFKTTPTGKDPAQEQDSCALVNPTSSAATDVLFTEMYVQCWDGPEGTGITDISNGLLDMGLQVAAATNAEYPIDFCLTHVGVVTGS